MSGSNSYSSTFSGMRLVGVNLSGAEFAPQNDPGTYNVDYTYPTHQEVDYYASNGMTVIRVPFLMDRMQATANGSLNQAQLGYMDDVVNYAASKGMKVILDPHDYGYEHGTLIDDSASDAAFGNFWEQMAAHYKGNAAVIFGLENEPHVQTAAQWLPAVNAAITAIRGAGATQEILVPAVSWESAMNFTTDGSSTTLAQGIKDPSNNYAFEVHQYLDSDASGGSTTIANGDLNTGPERLQAITQWAQQTGNKLFLGEIGVGTDTASTAALNNTLAYMQKNASVWQGVTYFAGGPWWGTTALSIEPTGLGTASITDRPQMKVLEQYAPAPASSSPPATPAAPDTLVINVSEDAWEGDAQFTVSVDGTPIGGVQTVTTLHSSGETHADTLTGTFGVGPHSVAISFINDAYGGTPTTDRNLYVQSVGIDGNKSTNPPATLLSNGTATFNVQVPSPAPKTSLVLGLSEDAWQGSAQFTAAVDGKSLGAAGSVTALHSLGESQAFTFSGQFGVGTHDLAVSFINDAYGGTPTTDRNLYVNSVAVNNVTVPGASATMLSDGATHFQFVVPS